MKDDILEKQLFEIIKDDYMPEHIKLAKIDMLISLGVNVNAIDKEAGYSYALGMTDSVEILQKLLDAGADVNLTDSRENSILECSLQRGHFNGADFLVKNGAIVNTIDKYGRSPLMNVRTLEAAEFLLNHGADLHYKDQHDRSALFYLFTMGKLPIVDYLLNKGGDKAELQEVFKYCTSDRDAMFLLNKGMKPKNDDLRWVIGNDYPNVALCFIENCENFDYSQKNQKGYNMLAFAVEHLRDERVALALIEKGADTSSYLGVGSVLLDAAYQGRLEVVKKMLDNGEDINQRNVYGQTPLYLAVLNGKEEVVEYLLEEGADYNIARDNGDTPLMCAVKHQECDVLEKLLDHMKEVPDKFSIACNLCLDGSDEHELLISFMERITKDKPSQRNKVMLDIIKDRY